MQELIESVPNFSEGADEEILDRIGRAIVSVPGTWLLDRTADLDHGRSVFTLAGHPEAVKAALDAAIAVAIEHIDLRTHSGQHPRLGGVDVVPFVPIGATTMDACVAHARAFAASIAARHEIPVFLYGKAALRADRTVLADVRQPRFEGLAEALALPGGEPDYGPRLPHPSAGAIVVGARPFLIAYNIQLASADLDIARRIARRIRERDGGLPGVQALGLALPSRSVAQVSMNILDHVATPLWRVWESVGALAEAESVAVLDSELIGLAPSTAFSEVADHIGVSEREPPEDRYLAAMEWLQIRGPRAEMVLEARLEQVRS